MDNPDPSDASATPRAASLIAAAALAVSVLAVTHADPVADLAGWRLGGLGPYLRDLLCVAVLSGCAWLLHLRAAVRHLCRDVLRLAAAEAGAHGVARSDALTGLPNRRAISERIDAALAGLWPGLGIAVLLIDLDGFKIVNDVYGHDIGDQVLCAAAARLRAALSFGTYLARLGGDEFAVLVPYSLQHRAADEAQAVVAALAEDIRVGEIVVNLGGSVGIARAPEDSADTPSLLRAADIAMYRAKQAGRGRVQPFHISMERDIRETAALRAELRAAIAEGQITPFYQPIVDLQSGRIVEFEVLARWQHPCLGCLPPDRFIHLVEGALQATPMLLSLLRQVARDAVGWPRHLQFSVNVFPAQLIEMTLVDAIEAALGDGAVPASRLCLEVTESALVQDGVRARSVIDAAHRAGMAVALDDFGTGYSSLYHLRELPFDRLKIDRSFVQPTDQRNIAYIGAILALCAALDLKVVAEGIETAEAARILARMGCHYGQGYHYSRPVPATQVAQLLADAACRGEPMPPAIAA